MLNLNLKLFLSFDSIAKEKRENQQHSCSSFFLSNELAVCSKWFTQFYHRFLRIHASYLSYLLNFRSVFSFCVSLLAEIQEFLLSNMCKFTSCLDEC